ISACVETLLDGAAEDPQHRDQFLAQISEQTRRLNDLILDLLSLARVEAGTETFEFRELVVSSLVAACIARHSARAAAKGIRLESESPSGVADATVWADEEACRQILDNLVDNALKYTPAGGRVAVRWQPRETSVVLQVADTGVGISAADMPRIFERFF